MHTRLTRTVAAAAGATALMLAGSPAFAAQPTATPPPGGSPSPATTAPPRWIQLSAPTGSPGDRLSVEIACEVEPGPIHSTALTASAPRRNAAGHQPWALFADATVRSVAAGHYPVTVTCGEQRLSTTLTVRVGETAPPAAPMAAGPLSSQQVRIVPQGAAATGDGSTAANSTGPLRSVGGGAVALGLLGFAAGLLRRRSHQEFASTVDGYRRSSTPPRLRR